MSRSRGYTRYICPCRGEDGKLLADDCPKSRLSRRKQEQEGHGDWMFGLRLDTSERDDAYLKRRGYLSHQEAQTALEHVRDLVKEAKADEWFRRKVGDLVFTRSRRGGSLPSVEEVRQLRELGQDPTSPKMTVGQWLEEWLATKGDTRDSTRSLLRYRVEAFFKPAFGDVPLDRLSRQHIDEMFTAIEAAGRVGSLVRQQLLGQLRSALKAAVDDGIIRLNPAAKVRRPKATPRTPQVWSPEEVAAFLDYVKDDRLAALFRLVLLRGLRRGEVCGLQWGDVNLDDGYLRVVRQLKYEGRTVEGPPKTDDGVREVSLPSGTVEALRRHRLRQAKERMALGLGVAGANDWIFSQPGGAHLRPPWVTTYFMRLSKKAGLPVIRLHDGRHTAGTMMRRAGNDAEVVAAQLGHRDPTFTLTVYVHPHRDTHAAAAEAAERLVDSGS